MGTKLRETISGGVILVNFAAQVKILKFLCTGKEIKEVYEETMLLSINFLMLVQGANAIGIDGTNGKITAKRILLHRGDVSA